MKDSIEAPFNKKNSITRITLAADKTSSSDNSIETIKAIGSLWPLLLTLTLIILVVFKWKNISKLIDRMKSAKIAGQQLDFGDVDKRVEATKVEKEKTIESQVAEEVIPKDEKDLFDIRQLYSDNKHEEAAKLLEEINSKEIDKEQISKNIILSFYFKYLAGYTDSIQEIVSYINSQQDNKVKAWGFYFVGECYSIQKSHALAKQNFEVAYQVLNYDDSNLLLHIIDGISNCIEITQSIVDKVSYLFAESKKTENKNIVLDIYIKIADATDNKLLKSIMLQIVLKERGNDTSLLFDTGYTLAEFEENVLAISFYKQLLNINPNDTSAINNLAVAYSRLKINSLSNFHFKKSSENGNTLATANLAFNLIDFGFYTEAEQILEKDRKKENIHENLIKAIDKLKKQRDEEKNKEKLIISQSDKLRAYFDTLGNDIISRQASNINLNNINYLSPSNDKIQLEQDSTSIQLTWIHGEYRHKISLKNTLFYGQAEYNITKDAQFVFHSEKEYSGYYNFNETLDSCSLIFYNDNEIIDMKILKV